MLLKIRRKVSLIKTLRQLFIETIQRPRMIIIKNNQLNLNELPFPDNLLKLKLQLQACNNEKCLAPETTLLNLIL